MEKRTIRTAAMVLILGLMTTPLLAQAFPGFGIIDELTSAGSTVGKKLVNFSFIFVGVIATISMIVCATDLLSNDTNTKKKVFTAGLILVGIFVMLGLLKLAFNF